MLKFTGTSGLYPERLALAMLRCYRLILELSVKPWLKCDFESIHTKSPKFTRVLNQHVRKNGVRLYKNGFLACRIAMGGPS